MEEGGTRDNREYFAAGKTIRNSQHIVDEWIEHNFPLQNRKEWGHACLGLGACCIVLALAPLPLLNCFLSRKMLLAANILITGGAFLVSGPTSIRRFLFAPRRRLGTVILFAGFTMVWRRWTILVCECMCVCVGVHCTLLYIYECMPSESRFSLSCPCVRILLCANVRVCASLNRGRAICVGIFFILCVEISSFTEFYLMI